MRQTGRDKSHDRSNRLSPHCAFPQGASPAAKSDNPDLSFRGPSRIGLDATGNFGQRRRRRYRDDMLHKVRNLISRRTTRICGAMLAIACWAAAVAAGWSAMLRFDFATSDAAPGSQLASWPEGSQLPRPSGEPILVVFLHPKCPCSPATLTELERVFKLASAEGGRTRVLVVPVTPPGAPIDWMDTDVVRQAAKLAGAQVCQDSGGFEAARFGARDSGTIMYFDAAGQRRFSGGITVARGQQGLSRSGVALAQILSHQRDFAPSSPAFGCRLLQPQDMTGSPISHAVAEGASRVDARLSNVNLKARPARATAPQAEL
jgi:hypothetical protein